MWSIIKAELKYNFDFLIPMAIGTLLYMTIQYYFTYVIERHTFLSATTLLQGSLFFTIFLRIRRTKESRDRLSLQLPLSLRKISLARLLIYLIYLSAMWLVILFIHGINLLFFPGTVFSITAIVALTGTVAIFTAIFLIILPDLSLVFHRGATFLKIPLEYILKVFQFLIGTAAVLLYLPIIAAIQNFPQVKIKGFFFRFLGSTYLDIMKNGYWSTALLLLGLVLFAISLWIFEKRVSYCN